MAGLGPNHPANKARAAQLSEQLGVEVTPDQAQRLSTQQIAEAHGVEVPETTTSPALAQGDLSEKFLDALGIERASWLASGLSLGQITHKGISSEADISEVIAEKGQDVFFDALKATSPDFSNVITKIESDPALAESFYNAFAKDPTMVSGMTKVLGAGEGQFNAADLNKILDDPRQREILGDVLDRVAESDKIDFSHVNKILNQHKAGDTAAMLSTLNEIGVAPPGFDLEMLMDFLSELMENPEMAISNLVDKLSAGGMIGDMNPDALKGYLAPVAEMAQFIAEPSHKLAVKYDLGRKTPGRIHNAAIEAGEEISAKYGVQTASNTVQQTLTEHIKAGLSDGELSFNEYKASVEAAVGVKVGKNVSLPGLDGVEELKGKFVDFAQGKSVEDIVRSTMPVINQANTASLDI